VGGPSVRQQGESRSAAAPPRPQWGAPPYHLSARQRRGVQHSQRHCLLSQRRQQPDCACPV